MGKPKRMRFLASIRLHGTLFGIVGLAAGILYSFGGLIVDALVSAGLVTTSETPGLSRGTLMAFGALFAMPLIGAAAGVAVGLAEAILYNVFARWLGAIDVDLQRKP